MDLLCMVASTLMSDSSLLINLCLQNQVNFQPTLTTPTLA